MPTEKITFAGHNGDQIAARLDLPDGPHLATALFAHCFACTKDILAARRIAGQLASAGIAVLRFDFTGLGHSAGEFANTSFVTNVEDLEAAAAYLATRDMAPAMLVGHSLGGAAALMAAGSIPSIRAVATIGAPFDPSHVVGHFADAVPTIHADGATDVVLGDNTVRIGRRFLNDLGSIEMSKAIKSMDAALLVLHAPRDEVVGIDNAAEIFQSARHPKSFVTLDNADHMLTDPQDAEYAASVIKAWAGRYLTLAPPAPPPGAPEGIVRVSEADPNGFLQDVTLGQRHHVLADEPEAYGGTNQGMSPYGFLAAGLGACTSMTIRMYARRKSWPLDHVWVEVSHDKVHAQDVGCTTDAKIDQFIRRIHLVGKLDDTQRAKLLEIADKCPVHRTLERSSDVVTRLVDA